MNTNIRVEYYLDQMLNSMTGRQQLRLQQLQRYPMCLICGSLPDTLREMIQMELAAKLGGGQAVGIVEPGPQGDVETETAGVVNSFRRKMESGDLKRLGQYYVPVVFLADQLKTGQLRSMLARFAAQMERMGCSYTLCCYGIFDYEAMDSAVCRQQLRNLTEDTYDPVPLCIYTQDCLAETEYQRYLKAIHSMTMHIFLESLKEPGQNSGLFVTGYWKLDVLRQKAADFLLRAVHRQEEELTGLSDYYAAIRDRLDQAAFLDEKEWIARFRRMPVKYQEISGLLHARGYLRRPARTYREILVLLYGREDAFPAFVETNLEESLSEADIRHFFSGGIGNLYAVKQNLEDVLQRLQKQYREDAENMRTSQSYDAVCRFERKKTIAELVADLENNFWRSEAAVLHAQRKERFAGRLLAYMRSAEFQETVRKLEERNQEEKKRLTLLAQETFMERQPDFPMPEVKLPIPQEWQLPDWDMDLFREQAVKEAANGMREAGAAIRDWMEQHADEVLGRFTADLQRLKLYRRTESYYAARLSGVGDGREQETLYIGFQGYDSDSFAEKLEETARLKLPEIRVRARSWESDLCFELSVIREIQSVDEIYGMQG